MLINDYFYNDSLAVFNLFYFLYLMGYMSILYEKMEIIGIGYVSIPTMLVFFLYIHLMNSI
jgi:hypothetical protein